MYKLLYSFEYYQQNKSGYNLHPDLIIKQTYYFEAGKVPLVEPQESIFLPK